MCLFLIYASAAVFHLIGLVKLGAVFILVHSSAAQNYLHL